MTGRLCAAGYPDPTSGISDRQPLPGENGVLVRMREVRGPDLLPRSPRLLPAPLRSTTEGGALYLNNSQSIICPPPASPPLLLPLTSLPPFCQSAPPLRQALPQGLRTASSRRLEGASLPHLPQEPVISGSSRWRHVSSVLPPLGGARPSSLHRLLALSTAMMENGLWGYLANGRLLPQTGWGGGWRLLYFLLSLPCARHTVGAQYIKKKKKSLEL